MWKILHKLYSKTSLFVLLKLISVLKSADCGDSAQKLRENDDKMHSDAEQCIKILDAEEVNRNYLLLLRCSNFDGRTPKDLNW